MIDAGGPVFVGDKQGTWTPLGPPQYRHEQVVAVDDVTALRVTFGVSEDGEHGPPTVEHLRLDDLLDPDVLWFGETPLMLGPDITFEAAELLGDPSRWQHHGVVTTVSVDGQECTITQRYGQAIVGTPAGEPIEIVPDGGGDPWSAYAQGGGRTLRLPEGATWLECGDPDHTMVLARALVRYDTASETDWERVEQARRRHAELQERLESEARRDDTEG